LEHHPGGSVCITLLRTRDGDGAPPRQRATGQGSPDAQHSLLLTVQDDGPGIPAAERGRVFERFHRGPGQEAVTGSGLGLSIVQQAVIRLGGQVWLGEGLGGRGVGFCVRIPLPSEI
jgi:signal transduction histidine kinase